MFSILGIVGNILLSLALYYLTYLLTKDNNKQKNKAPGKDEYNFPLAVENTPVAKIFGRRKIEGFNVLKWDITKQERIVIKSKSLFGTEKQETPNFKTYADMHLGFCLANDDNAVKLINVLVNNEIIYTNPSTTVENLSFNINKQEYFGEDNGFGGAVDFYCGADNQVKSSYLNTNLYNGKASRFQKLAYLILKNFYLTNSTTAPLFSFILENLPKPEWTTQSVAGWDGKINPAVAIWYILTDDLAGGSIDPSYLNVDSFIDIALKLKDEDFGIAFIRQSQRSVIEEIGDILETIDGNLYTSIDDGLIHISLNNADYNIEDLLHIKLKEDILNYSSSRNSISTQFSEVRVKFTDASKNYQERFAIYKNPSTRLKKGRQEIKELSYNMVTDFTTASKIAAREGIPLTRSLISLSLETNRKLSTKKVGDVIKVSIDKLDIYEMPFRITKINFGKSKSSTIKVELLQDYFGQFKQVFSNDNPSLIIDRTATALNCNLKVLTAPAYFNKSLDIQDNLILTFAERPNNRHQYFDLYTDSTTTTDFIKNGFSSGFSFVGTLTDNINIQDNEFNVTSNFFDTINYQKDLLNNGYNLAVILDEINNKQEFINFENVIYNDITDEYEIKNINRGLLDTLPKSFISGSKIYVFSYGYAINNTDFFLDSENIQIKALTKTSNETLDISDASLINYTVSNRQKLPINISNLKINGLDYNDNITIPTVDLVFDFSYRNKINTIQYYNDVNISNTDLNNVRIKIYNISNTLIQDITLSSNETSWTFTDELTINAGIRYTYLRAEIFTKKSTFDSLEKYDIIITR